MAPNGTYSFAVRGEGSNSLRVTARELHANNITQLESQGSRGPFRLHITLAHQCKDDSHAHSHSG